MVSRVFSPDNMATLSHMSSTRQIVAGTTARTVRRSLKTAKQQLMQVIDRVRCASLRIN